MLQNHDDSPLLLFAQRIPPSLSLVARTTFSSSVAAMTEKVKNSGRCNGGEKSAYFSLFSRPLFPSLSLLIRQCLSRFAPQEQDFSCWFAADCTLYLSTISYFLDLRRAGRKITGNTHELVAHLFLLRKGREIECVRKMTSTTTRGVSGEGERENLRSLRQKGSF